MCSRVLCGIGWLALTCQWGGKHHYSDAALMLTKQIHLQKSMEQSKLATVNTIDVASGFHYNTLLFQLMTNFFSTIWKLQQQEEERESKMERREEEREGALLVLLSVRGSGQVGKRQHCQWEGGLDVAMIGLCNGHFETTISALCESYSLACNSCLHLWICAGAKLVCSL